MSSQDDHKKDALTTHEKGNMAGINPPKTLPPQKNDNPNQQNIVDNREQIEINSSQCRVKNTLEQKKDNPLHQSTAGNYEQIEGNAPAEDNRNPTYQNQGNEHFNPQNEINSPALESCNPTHQSTVSAEPTSESIDLYSPIQGNNSSNRQKMAENFSIGVACNDEQISEGLNQRPNVGNSPAWEKVLSDPQQESDHSVSQNKETIPTEGESSTPFNVEGGSELMRRNTAPQNVTRNDGRAGGHSNQQNIEHNSTQGADNPTPPNAVGSGDQMSRNTDPQNVERNDEQINRSANPQNAGNPPTRESANLAHQNVTQTNRHFDLQNTENASTRESSNLTHHNTTGNDEQAARKIAPPNTDHDKREIPKSGSHAPKSPPRLPERHVQLPNGKQNEYYEVDLSQFQQFKDLVDCNIHEDQQTELTLCPDTYVLKGIISREATDECQLVFYGKNAQHVTVKVIATFIINPDPKTLWKEIEPTSPFFRKPHRHFERIVGEYGTLTAARVRGRSHAQRGAFCEDDFAIMTEDQFGYFGMVADGAGSAKFSRLGSKLLAESLPRFLHHIFEQQLIHSHQWQRWDQLLQGTPKDQQVALGVMKKLFSSALQHSAHVLHQHTLMSLKDEQTGEDVAIRFRDLYSTCLAFWAYPVAGKRWALISYWVGDGGLAVKHGGRFSLLGRSDGGEFSGQTRFFTDQEITPEALEKRLRAAIYEDLQSVWAFSDGVTDPKFASEKQLANSAAWQDLTAEITPHLTTRESIFQWLAFWSQGEHDDRSLCVLEIKGKNNE